ncbi:MAG TPA: hypothetical protein VD769_06055 [Gaiellaceae bacterium]|nr:hypothetical protein [Gaiellaceae bacterium]
MTDIDVRERQLYIVPVSAPVARARATRTVFGGVKVASLGAAQSDGSCELIAEFSKDPACLIHVWAVRASRQLRGTWSRIATGDWFLFYSRGTILGAARVHGTCESGSMADALWGSAGGSEFRLFVIFDRVERLEVPAWTYREVLGSRFIGFRRLSDDLRGALVRRFGSVDAFVEKELSAAHAVDR